LHFGAAPGKTNPTYGNLEMVKYLVENGADVHALDIVCIIL
jgi:hypothetical protein